MYSSLVATVHYCFSGLTGRVDHVFEKSIFNLIIKENFLKNYVKSPTWNTLVALMHHAGDITTLVGIVVIPYVLSQAIIFCYTCLLLQRCISMDPHIKCYPDIGHLAFGPKGKIFISTFIYLQLFLLDIGFLILTGHIMVVLPTTWLKSLGRLPYVSATANIYAVYFTGHGVLPTSIRSMKDRSKGSKIIIYVVVIPRLSKYAQVMASVAAAIEELFPLCKKCVALIFPVFWSMMAFIRSFLGSTIALILLCICYLKIFEGTKSCKVEKVIVMGILMIGFCIATLETYFNVKRIMQQM
ncbi:hypothetical protein AMTRI_Chr09g12770 [Amborella trichopoda]